MGNIMFSAAYISERPLDTCLNDKQLISLWPSLEFSKFLLFNDQITKISHVFSIWSMGSSSWYTFSIMISFSFILLFFGEKQIEQGNALYFAPQSISGGKIQTIHFHITNKLFRDGWFKLHNIWYKQVCYHIFFISLTDYFCSCLSCLDFLSNNNLFFNALHTLINKRLALGYIYCFKWYIFLDIFSRIFLHYLSIKSLFWSGFAWTEPTGFKTWRKSNEKVCYILLFLQFFFFFNTI